ncbi:hypothetical protein K3177_05040 [Qipengyuania sp. GH25]|uniref:Uncharacterized protein n=1 Tax=Qipengyuania pacifica TaxID=2860199 RepID=A0ABS7JCW2_9SPHN|nr:hypothetical protein [Qipengyuania aerophila]MBX7487872.1 hypothetical protein [Qipengyuania aerophila]
MSSTAVQRYVFRELREGDLEKFNATSSTSGTGGGARDIRFRSPSKFDPVFASMFPNRKAETRRDGAGTYTSTIYHADVAVHIAHTNVPPSDPRVQNYGSDQLVIDTLEYWPPARTGRYKDESRVGRVNKFSLNPPRSQGTVFALIYQDGTPLSPRLSFVTEDAVKNRMWEKSVNDFFSDLFLQLPAKGAVMGYRDLVSNQTWVNL